jgi:hypothetical protein
MWPYNYDIDLFILRTKRLQKKLAQGKSFMMRTLLTAPPFSETYIKHEIVPFLHDIVIDLIKGIIRPFR